MRPAGLAVAAVALAMAAPAVANAAWTGSGSGVHYAKAVSMPAGKTPTASVSNRSVTVSWAASNLPDGTAIASYTVKRYDTSGNVQTIGSGCSGTISALTCTETAVPGGTWKYAVTPVRSNWTGAEGPQSASVTVASPSLSFSSSTTVTSLPTTLNGSIAAFVGGQTVTFRLDDPTSGTVLSGTLSPTPVPSAGGSSVTVTIPAGTANGAHTVYAVGSGGSDVASAAITVAVSSTMTTTAWDVRDASSGTESNQSAQPAFADALTFSTGSWATAFSLTRYVDFNMNAPLPAGAAVSGATFAFKYAGAQSGDTVCYWFEVRHASTGTLFTGGTHGGPTAPVDCTTGTTLKTVSTPLAEVTTTDLANDTRVRVYGRSTGSRPITIDLATVSGTQQSTAFTLFTSTYTDAASGTASAFPWSIAAADTAFDTSAASWATAFSGSRYLTYSFPSYIPSTATVTGATFTHSYRPTVSGHNACYYFEVYAGSTRIGTHGSTASPFSCNSTASFKTDGPFSLPEIDTAAEANSAVVKMYFWVSGNGTRTTDHDLAQLTIDYQ